MCLSLLTPKQHILNLALEFHVNIYAVISHELQVELYSLQEHDCGNVTRQIFAYIIDLLSKLRLLQSMFQCAIPDAFKVILQ
jgi:hypothetical protein